MNISGNEKNRSGDCLGGRGMRQDRLAIGRGEGEHHGTRPFASTECMSSAWHSACSQTLSELLK